MSVENSAQGSSKSIGLPLESKQIDVKSYLDIHLLLDYPRFCYAQLNCIRQNPKVIKVILN